MGAATARHALDWAAIGAGLQIALTEPICINDVLIVEGQWDRVEDITGTYVVFRIWDERRMIFPLQRFIANPFENWTRPRVSGFDVSRRHARPRRP